MKIYAIDSTVNLKGQSGAKFVKENFKPTFLMGHIPVYKKDKIILEEAKNSFGIKSKGVIDLLESLISEIKRLIKENDILKENAKKLEVENKRLMRMNIGMNNELDACNDKIHSLRYKNKLLKRNF